MMVQVHRPPLLSELIFFVYFFLCRGMTDTGTGCFFGSAVVPVTGVGVTTVPVAGVWVSAVPVGLLSLSPP